jgi:hypothetical protein
MLRNQQQYQDELQARFLKNFTPDANEKLIKKQRKIRARANEDLTGANGEKASLLMNRMIDSKYIVQTVILDSAHRNLLQFPNANDYVIKILEPLRNVAAVRLLKTEYFEPCSTQGYFVMNGVKIPLQSYNLDHAYLYLNGWINTIIANDTNTNLFGRVAPGVDTYPAVAGNIENDPYTYILRPSEPRLRRFHVRLLTHEGQLQAVTNARVILTLAFYCLP